MAACHDRAGAPIAPMQPCTISTDPSSIDTYPATTLSEHVAYPNLQEVSGSIALIAWFSLVY